MTKPQKKPTKKTPQEKSSPAGEDAKKTYATPPQGAIPLDPGVWLQRVKVSDLKPNDWNPNEMSAEQYGRLKARIQKVGVRHLILARPDLTITDGEHRWKALKDIGKTETWVIIADETLDESKIETAVSNLLHGEFNPIKYGKYLTDLTSRIAVEELAALIPTPKAQIEALAQLVQDLPEYSPDEVRRMVAQQKWVIKLEFGNEEEYKEAERIITGIQAAQTLKSNAATVLYLLRRFGE